jgi:hypothetical protein
MQRTRKSKQNQLTPRLMTRKQIQNLGLNADQTVSEKATENKKVLESRQRNTKNQSNTD